MCVREVVRIFQPEREHPVHTNMTQPDDAKSKHDRVVTPPAKAHQESRQRRRVREVVEVRPESGSEGIAGSEDIGYEKHRDREPPRFVRCRKRHDRTNEKCQPFDE